MKMININKGYSKKTIQRRKDIALKSILMDQNQQPHRRVEGYVISSTSS